MDRALIVIPACAVAVLGAGVPAQAATVLTSFDGTPLVVRFHEAAWLGAGDRAPTVLLGAGFPASGDDPGAIPPDQLSAATLRSEGYNVVTWDPRGLGGSGGTVTFDSPDFEARDVQAIVDWVASRPQALLDAPGDPRVGMSGSSYGGAIQLVSSAVEPRIDVIAPNIAWHSLVSALFKEGGVKLGWFATAVCGAGEVAGTFGGSLFGPAGVQLGSLDSHIRRACAEALTAGRLSAASTRWFADRGPAQLLDRIRAPTLITQGTADTLFGLGEAASNFDALRRNEVPVKMLWHCGGHGACATGTGEHAHVARAGLAWLARWLRRDATVDTGPRFEWLADDGRWRSAPDFPIARAGTVATTGNGTLTISPADNLHPRYLLSARPAANALNASFAVPPGADLVGAPTVSLTYRGSASPASTLLFAQILDARRNRVLGDQATPLPVILDGRTRTVQRPLETIAARGGARSDLRLQVTPGTPLYAPQRSLGSVQIALEGSLPLVRAASGPRRRQTPKRLSVRVTARRRHGTRGRRGRTSRDRGTAAIAARPRGRSAAVGASSSPRRCGRPGPVGRRRPCR